MSTNITTMRLHIAPSQPVSEIQKEFNKEYPFLKLEFFNKRAISTGDYCAAQLVPGHKKIGDIQLTITDGEIEISGEMKVSELENLLRNKFYVAAQVFRKSGNLWLETTMTDNWTLNQQTAHGKELSIKNVVNAKAADYDLERDADH